MHILLCDMVYPIPKVKLLTLKHPSFNFPLPFCTQTEAEFLYFGLVFIQLTIRLSRFIGIVEVRDDI